MLITIKEASRRTGRSISTISKHARSGHIRSQKIDGTRYVDDEDIEKIKNIRTRNPRRIRLNKPNVPSGAVTPFNHELFEHEQQYVEIPDGMVIERTEGNRIYYKPIPLPGSWEEYASTHGSILPPNVRAAIENLGRLVLLRNAYNGDWHADWSDSASREPNIFPNIFIGAKKEGVLGKGCRNPSLFAFKNKELRNKFYNNFKPLIDTIKHLIP